MNRGPIWLVGCGNMGGAMLRRWIADGADPAAFLIIDPGAPDAPIGVRIAAAPDADAPRPSLIILAVKPQQLSEAAALLAPALLTPALLAPAPGLAAAKGGSAGQGDTLLISILAGVEQATLAQLFPTCAIVRAMPNLPVAIGRGVVALHSDAASGPQRLDAEVLMQPLGLVEWMAEEASFDAVTALSGSGPGFLFRFIEALGEAGAAIGLPADQAARLALATVEGSALMAAQSGEQPGALADRVASKGGSTREGLDVLDRDRALVELLTHTLAAAKRRNAEMAAAAR